MNYWRPVMVGLLLAPIAATVFSNGSPFPAVPHHASHSPEVAFIDRSDASGF